MGAMQTWMWGVKYPGLMHALVPMASQPTGMSSRNWMLRRLIVDSIRTDPEWNNGNYTRQPRSAQFSQERIEAAVLAINAADDERNPPETGIMEREMKRLKNGRYDLISASEQTAGHGTTGQAKWWNQQLAELLRSAPRRP